MSSSGRDLRPTTSAVSCATCNTRSATNAAMSVRSNYPISCNPTVRRGSQHQSRPLRSAATAFGARADQSDLFAGRAATSRERAVLQLRELQAKLRQGLI